ncbi:MAG: DNA (cytosine-5-)-methyltransferase [Erysipelotrichia bacterium]|nr:DNA (cytosine-5-)-methyltransferase [Erysipelotrichia bacterium]NCC54175.1 DNA (cytosine-5-)-methyltransferase [Erysipelotrichia bacterium]
MSKHTVARYIKELIQDHYLLPIDQKGKYKITKEGHYALDILGKDKRLLKASQFKCASFFAGVGGIDLGFKNIGFETIYANEFDKNAIQTYEYNYDLKVDHRDIHEVVNDLNNHIDPFKQKKINILLAGFPCQAFSIAGYREGFEDKKGRGGLFFEVMKIIRQMKPEVVFLENVKNLVSHDHGKTYKIIKEALKSERYYIKELVMNSMFYGNVPQNRERIYIVAFKDKKKREQFHFPYPIELEKKLSDVIDFKHKVDERYYYTEKFKHFDEIKDKITSQNTVYQWRRVYVRENKNNVCPTLTANMGTGGHNVPLILTDYGIRKLTPHECFALQGFNDDYKLPPYLAISHLYKQAGNSVSVSVIERIAKEILKVL